MVFDKVIRAALCAVLVAPFLSAAAQSGRVAKPPPTTPTTQSAVPGRADIKPKFDGNASVYKLVFATEYEGKRFFTGKKDRELMGRTRRAKFDNFIGRLNEAGSQGYKLKSVVANDPFVALVKLDETRYEYEWFETDSRMAFYAGGFEEKYKELSERGFRLADHSLLSRNCEDIDPDNSVTGEVCEYKHLFLVERQKGAGRPGHFERVSSAPVRGSKPAAELTAQVKERLAEGFYPTSLFSAFEVLVEQPPKGDERPVEGPELQVVRASSFWELDNLEEKVNERARQGYRLTLVNNRIALMYRPAEAATPATYVWVNAKDKGFEKRLARLQESGAVYRLTYADDEGDETRLIFEQGAGDGRRREYKVLTFEFKIVENAAAMKVHVELAPPGKEALKALDRLVKEGFSVRDLFYSNNVSVILERPL